MECLTIESLERNRFKVEKKCEELQVKTAIEIGNALSVNIPQNLIDKLMFEYFDKRRHLFFANLLPAALPEHNEERMKGLYEYLPGLELFLKSEEKETVLKPRQYNGLTFGTRYTYASLDRTRSWNVLETVMLDIEESLGFIYYHKLLLPPPGVQDERYILSLIRKHFNDVPINDKGRLEGGLPQDKLSEYADKHWLLFTDIFERLTIEQSNILSHHMRRMLVLYSLKDPSTDDKLSNMTSDELDRYLRNTYHLGKPETNDK